MFFVKDFDEKNEIADICDTFDNKSEKYSKKQLSIIIKFLNDEIYGVMRDYWDNEIYAIKAGKDLMTCIANYYRIVVLDKVYDTYNGKDFIEITGSTGGDNITFRIYKNGEIFER